MPGNARTSSKRVGDGPSCFATICCAAVIPEARPQPQHFFLRSSGKRVNVREALQKSFVVGDGGGHARLLQHNFRKPDAIRIFRASPRQVTLELAEPAQQLFAKCSELAAVQHDAGTFSHSRAEETSSSVLIQKI